MPQYILHYKQTKKNCVRTLGLEAETAISNLNVYTNIPKTDTTDIITNILKSTKVLMKYPK
jgi:hypothetical protein